VFLVPQLWNSGVRKDTERHPRQRHAQGRGVRELACSGGT
jgi:hypothetical protein